MVAGKFLLNVFPIKLVAFACISQSLIRNYLLNSGFGSVATNASYVVDVVLPTPPF